MPAQDASHSGMRVMLLSNDPRLRMPEHAAAELGHAPDRGGNHPGSAGPPARGREPGPALAYSVVVADIAGMRNTAIALRRNLEHHAIYGQVRLLCLYGDEAAPEELRERATLLSRNAQDNDLRVALAPPPRRRRRNPRRWNRRRCRPAISRPIRAACACCWSRTTRST